MGAGIEIGYHHTQRALGHGVASRVGAGIEMLQPIAVNVSALSRPVWARGLKY